MLKRVRYTSQIALISNVIFSVMSKGMRVWVIVENQIIGGKGASLR